MTFRDGRLDGARVDVVGARAGCIEVLDNFFGVGTRRLDAAEGGGIRDELVLADLVRNAGASADFVAGFRRGGLIERDEVFREGGSMEICSVWTPGSILGGRVAAVNCTACPFVSRYVP